MDKQVAYRLKLSGEGLDLERDVAPETAHAIVRLVFGGPLVQAATGAAPAQPLVTLPQPPLAAPAAPAVAALSVREFMETHNAKRIPEQIATIALFLKQHENLPVFGRKDLVRSFEAAQEPVPKNLPRDIAWTVKNAWIAPKSGAKKSFYLTGTGESAVTAKFP
ncbi:MAG: hypothetical protein PHR35_17760, partial [Kiritimatiellae bacterium]|nr:hypothetical protein [Kiritimatiellia bacterium]